MKGRKRFWRRAGAVLAVVLIIIVIAVWRAEREAEPVAQPVAARPAPDAKKATAGSPIVHDRPDRERGPRP